MKKKLRINLSTFVATLFFAGAASATMIPTCEGDSCPDGYMAASWSDILTWDPAEKINPRSSVNYTHDISDDGFNIATDFLANYSLNITLHENGGGKDGGGEDGGHADGGGEDGGHDDGGGEDSGHADGGGGGGGGKGGKGGGGENGGHADGGGEDGGGEDGGGHHGFKIAFIDQPGLLADGVYDFDYTNNDFGWSLTGLAQLNSSGLLSISIDSWRGNFYLDSSTLNARGCSPVPEPATMLLFGSGLAAFAGKRLRKRQKV